MHVVRGKKNHATDSNQAHPGPPICELNYCKTSTKNCDNVSKNLSSLFMNTINYF